MIRSDRSSDMADLIVFRADPALPSGWLPDLDGRWFDKREFCATPVGEFGIGVSGAVAIATGDFEFDESGRCAEVWRVTSV